MNVRLQYTMSFTAGVHYNDQLIMNNYLFRAYMITNVKEAELTNTAFERLKYFISEEMDSTVFINSENQEAAQRYVDAGIRITTLPNEPVDQIVGVMLFHKLNAIMEDRISVVETELSSHLGENMVYIHSENEISQDIEIPAWWTSPDITHCELEFGDGDTIFAIPPTSISWRDLDMSWPNEVVTETGNVVFAEFGRDDTKQ
jgi:hypothetical protein